MTIVHKCCGVPLKNSPFWMIIAITVGCLLFAGNIWITFEMFRTSEPTTSNIGGLVKFLYSILIFKLCTCAKEIIVKLLCVINLLSSPCWLFGVITKKRAFSLASLIWWTIVVLMIYMPYMYTSVLIELIHWWKESNNTFGFVIAIGLHTLATAICVIFYLALVISNRAMKEHAYVDDTTDVLQRQSPTNIPIEGQSEDS